MRIMAIFFLTLWMLTGLATAATIDLSDGRSIQGDILKQDNRSLQVSVDGVTMTYYADEIKDIDGKSFMAVQPQPVAVPSAVPQPEAVNRVLSVPVPMPGADMIDPEKRILILKFIDVFGTRQALTNNFDLMVKQIAKEKPDEAQKIRQNVKVDEIIDRLLPIYDRHFTSEDLKAFIAFYGSPEGQKLISSIPDLMKESVLESIKYMQEKFPEVKEGQ